MRKKRKNILLLSSSVAIFVAAVIAIFIFRETTNTNVVKIAGTNISENEYTFWLDRNKNSVISKNYGAGETVDWSKINNGKTIAAELIDKAIEEMKEVHIIWDMAAKSKLIDSPTYEAFMSRLKNENNHRSMQLETDEIVYGVQEFDVKQYLAYELNYLVNTMQEDSDWVFSETTDEDLQTFYEEHKESHFSIPPDLSFSYMSIETYGLDEAGKEEVYEDLKNIRASLLTGQTFEDVVSAYPEYEDYFASYSFTSDEVRGSGRSFADEFALLSNMHTGDISEITDMNGVLFLMQCTERVENGYRDFSSTIALVRNEVREIQFEEYLSEMKNEAEVEVLVEDLESFTIQLLEVD